MIFETEFFDRLEANVGIIHGRTEASKPFVAIAQTRTIAAPKTKIAGTRVAARGNAVAVSIAIALTLGSTPPANATQQTGGESARPVSADLVSSPFPNLLARVSRFAKLQPGWNGPSTVPPSAVSTSVALRVVKLFGGYSVRSNEPQVAPLDEGGYQFEWRNGARELYVACSQNGELTILESAPGHEKEYSGEIDRVLKPALAWLAKS